MKKILITGCFGFIGKTLTDEFKKNGYDVYGIGHSNVISPQQKSFIQKEISFSNLDESLSLMDTPPDVIYHLAGGSSVSIAENNPLENYQKTVNSSNTLFEWVRLNSPKSRIIVASSAAIYGANHCNKLSEMTPTQPFSVYGHHKKIVEQLSNIYIEKYSLDIINARIFSVYGNGLKKQFLWDFCSKLKAASHDDSINVFGTGNEVRDWIHISDLVNALKKISEINTVPSVINIGTGKGTTIKQMIEYICNSWFGENKLKIQFNGNVREGDPFSLISDATIKNTFVGSHKINLQDGVNEYVNWYKAHSNEEN
ncbi:NAD-dependent epimerase/dehydratase [Providencia rettgeri]